MQTTVEYMIRIAGIDEIIILADRWIMRTVIPSAETLGISSFEEV